METKQVLLIGMGTEETSVRKKLEDLELEILSADASVLGRTVGQAFTAPGDPGTGEVLSPAMILFRNFRQQDLDPVLKAIREAGLSRQPMKAMVTPTNWRWKLEDLYRELQQEQQIMGALMRLKQVRDSLSMPDYMDIPAMQAWFRAEHLLHGGEDATLEAIEEAIQALKRYAK